MIIIESDIPKGRICLAVTYLEFDNVSYVMYVFTRHGLRHDTRNLIEYPGSVLKLSVSLIIKITTGGNTSENISKQSRHRSGPKFR